MLKKPESIGKGERNDDSNTHQMFAGYYADGFRS